MLFHRVRLKKKQLNIYFRGETIFRVNSTKFLGVIIDNKLKWTAHIFYLFIYLFIQNLYSALFTNKRALMRYSIIKSITKSYYSESKNTYE